MSYLMCKIINETGGTQKGKILDLINKNEEFVINWVFRNCKGSDEIIIKNNKKLEIIVNYEDRSEIYTII